MSSPDLEKRNLLNLCIPNRLWVNRDIDYRSYKKAKVLVSFLLVGLLTFSLLGLAHIITSKSTHSIFLCCLSVGVQSLLLFLFKYFNHYKVAAYGLLCGLLAILFYHQLHSEPFLISHMVWAPIFPMLGAMLLGVRGAFVITFLSLGNFLGASIWVEAYGAIELLRTHNANLDIVSIILSSSVMFCIVYFYDLSQHEVFALLEKKNRELERISEDNRLLTAIVTHDLSNPLTTMGIYGDKIRSILKQELGEGHDVYLKCAPRFDRFFNAHNSCIELVHNVKNTLALQMKKIEVSLKETDLLEAFKNVISDYQHLAQAKKITIRINRLTDESLSCLAEPISLKTSILSNLISNAIKFSDEGSVIDINLNRKGDKIVFEVRDYGVGISEDKLLNLFELKHSTSAVGTFGERGTGYGLPIVKSFVEKFKGEIKVDSIDRSHEKGDKSGTSVIVSLLSA